MKVLQTHYDGTDRTLGHVSELLNLVDLTSVSTSTGQQMLNQTHLGELQMPQAHHNVGTSLASVQIQCFTDVVIYQPQNYLRISHTVDFFLSSGRFPTETDFPTPLQIKYPRIKLPIYNNIHSSLGITPGNLPTSQNCFLEQRGDHQIEASESPESMELRSTTSQMDDLDHRKHIDVVNNVASIRSEPVILPSHMNARNPGGSVPQDLINGGGLLWQDWNSIDLR